MNGDFVTLLNYETPHNCLSSPSPLVIIKGHCSGPCNNLMVKVDDKACPFRFVGSDFCAVLNVKSSPSSSLNCRTITFRNSVSGHESHLSCRYICPNQGPYLRTIIFYPKDEGWKDDEIRDFEARADLTLDLAVSILTEKLWENGFERRSLRTLIGAQCLQFSLTSSEIRGETTTSLWKSIAVYLRNNESLWDEDCKYIVFVSGHWKKSEKEPSALGGGGLALLSADLLKSFPSDAQDILQHFWTGSCTQNRESFGSVLHELGHILNLGHSKCGLMGQQYFYPHHALSPLVSYPIVQRDQPLSHVGVKIAGDLDNDFDRMTISYSAAQILAHHRWLLPQLPGVPGSVQLIGDCIKSERPLVVAEIRTHDTELVLRAWTWTSEENKTEFTIGKHHIPMEAGDQAVIIAESADGALLHAMLHRAHLRQTFTSISIIGKGESHR